MHSNTDWWGTRIYRYFRESAVPFDACPALVVAFMVLIVGPSEMEAPT